jgi:hypothetical protein
MRLVQTAGAAVVMTAASLFSYAEEPFDAESLRRSQGELLLQIEQLRQETQALRGLMEELSYQLGQMSRIKKRGILILINGSVSLFVFRKKRFRRHRDRLLQLLIRRLVELVKRGRKHLYRTISLIKMHITALFS